MKYRITMWSGIHTWIGVEQSKYGIFWDSIANFDVNKDNPKPAFKKASKFIKEIKRLVQEQGKV